MGDEARSQEELLAEVRRLRMLLQEREEAPRAAPLIEQLPDAVVVIGEDERLLYVNEATLQLAGVSDPEVLLGRPVWAFIHPEDEWHTRERRRLLKKGRAIDFVEQQLIRPDGETVPVETASVPILFDGRRAALTTVRDLRGRAHMERALSEAQDLFYTSFQASPAAISITRLPDGLILEVNREWCRLTGYDEEEVVGHRTTNFDIWVESALRDEFIRMMEEEGAVHDYEVDIRMKGGKIRTVLASLQKINIRGEACLLSVMNDITDRKFASQALLESEARFRTLADSAPVMIWMAGPDQRFIYVNKGWLHFTGKTMVEEIGAGWAAGVHPEDRAHRAEIYASHFERRDPFRMEYRLRRRDGTYRWVLDIGVPRFTPDGRFLGYIGSAVDISERKETERALVEAKERAEEMARLRSTILTNMTHEVRTPLTVILGFTSMLRQGVRKDYQRFVQRIERSGRRLLLMLDAILDLAQLEANELQVEREPFNVVDVVHGVIEPMREAAREKGLELKVELPEQHVYASLDHRVLMRVLNNLIDNAIKFTDQGRIVLRLEADEDFIRLSVTDTGIGIEDTYLPHVFDEFSQESSGLERTHQGSGLGLSVSKRLVELMGGSILVESHKDEGSIFKLTFPRGANLGVPV